MSGESEQPTGSTSSGPFWKKMFTKKDAASSSSDDETETAVGGISRWNMGMLNDKETIAVPGSVLLLASDHNEPLGLRNQPARTSHSSLPTGVPEPPPPAPPAEPAGDELGKKKTNDGQIILEPQPDDSRNDPLNWPSWRRDAALLSLGLYCMIGGGTTPLLAAGFTDVSEDYDVPVSEVALTTGLYMLGMGIGSVIFSPTAILYGKRPVYLFSAVIFILSAVWCALSPNFISLMLARIFQGIAVSPVECLPSATIAEIFFLHERAYRIGVYTLLLLGGKNLVPLVSAVIIESLGWRWVFWIVAIVVGFCGILLFFFVPETFWDRTPIRFQPKRPGFFSRQASRRSIPRLSRKNSEYGPAHKDQSEKQVEDASTRSPAAHHVGFAVEDSRHEPTDPEKAAAAAQEDVPEPGLLSPQTARPGASRSVSGISQTSPTASPTKPRPAATRGLSFAEHASVMGQPDVESQHPQNPQSSHLGPLVSDSESDRFSLSNSLSNAPHATSGQIYTHHLRKAAPQSFRQQLALHNGRLQHDVWWKAAVRPFILFAYPGILWSAAIYSMSIGWLIVISESVSLIYRDGSYEFNALQTGLVYISPFIGGVLGTAVAGRVSDVIVKAMAKRNGGLYEPEFRLVMAIPIAITTVIGLMGFGWSAQKGDAWIVPTVFFGIVSFGCSLGSTTAITFCVDSYRQYAGEALVTLNFSKNVFHGLVFSLFVAEWMETDGTKSVYIWIGVIQLIFCFMSIPMYIYGKRMRMWTVRANLMEKF